MKRIKLTQGKVAIIDNEDYHLIAGYKWAAMKCRGGGNYYARTWSHDKPRKVLLMHRLIFGAQAGQQCDHKDRNGLNNRRQNLRIATPSQNGANRKVPNKTGWQGVYRSNRNLKRRFTARVKVNGKMKHLGYFATAKDAARARDKAAFEAFGEFARLNFKPKCQNQAAKESKKLSKKS